MEKTPRPSYAELVALVARLESRIADLESQLAAAQKNSRNSSKPPSSDITKPPSDQGSKTGRRKPRHIGGQDGHPKHESGLTVDAADHVVELRPDQIPGAPSRDLAPAPGLEPKIIFQYELVEKPVELTAYVAHPYRDRGTGEISYAPFPKEVEEAGLIGPRLTAFAACLKGGIHASYSGAEKVLGLRLRRFLGADVCRATLCNKIKKVAAALGFAHGELLAALPAEPRLNIDETGHHDSPFRKPANHGKHWVWVFAATLFTVFKIFGDRSTDALRTVLSPACAAIIGSDFYSAYKCFMKETNIRVQFCWAHLIRDIKFLTESADKVTANYGRRLLGLCKLIFHLQHRRAELGEEKFRRRMTRLKRKFLATGRRGASPGVHDLSARLRDYGEEYFLFL